MRIRILLIAEMEVPDDSTNPLPEAEARLDEFREAVLPSSEYGIVLARTSGDEMDSRDLLVNGWDLGRADQ